MDISPPIHPQSSPLGRIAIMVYCGRPSTSCNSCRARKRRVSHYCLRPFTKDTKSSGKKKKGNEVKKTFWLTFKPPQKSATKQSQNAANVVARGRNAPGTEIPQASSFATRAHRSSIAPAQKSLRGRRRPPQPTAARWSAQPHHRHRTNNQTLPHRTITPAAPPMSSTRPCWT